MVSTNFANGKALPAMMDADPLDERIAGLIFLSLYRRAFCQQRRFADKSCRSKKTPALISKNTGVAIPAEFCLAIALGFIERLDRY